MTPISRKNIRRPNSRKDARKVIPKNERDNVSKKCFKNFDQLHT